MRKGTDASESAESDDDESPSQHRSRLVKPTPIDMTFLARCELADAELGARIFSDGLLFDAELKVLDAAKQALRQDPDADPVRVGALEERVAARHGEIEAEVFARHGITEEQYGSWLSGALTKSVLADRKLWERLTVDDDVN